MYSLALSNLSQGAHSLTARLVVNGSETTLGSGAISTTIDRTAPTLSPSQSLTSDTGTASDGITSNGAVRLSGTVSDNLTTTTVAVWDAATNLRLGNATITNGAWSYSTTLAAGAHQLYAVATDLAGNNTTSALQSQITVDRTAPTLTGVTQALASDTGTSATDRITSNGAVTVTGTLTENLPGATVAVWDATASAQLGLATVGAGGAWTFSTVLAAGAHQLYALATDVAGNTGRSGNLASITVDASAPTIAIAGQALTADTGISNSDRITSNGAFTLTGTVADNLSGATVGIWDAVTGSRLGNATVNSGQGTWSYSGTLAEGSHSLYAIATDTAGTMTTTATQPLITVDRAAPAPLFADLTTTGSGTYSFTGTTQGSASVSLFDGAATAAFVTSTAAADGTFTVTGSLPTTATHAITLRSTDLAGNTGTSTSKAYVGTTGADVLKGGAGNDLFYGAAGNDRFTGGAGSDTFIFKAGFGKDVITDFTVTGTAHDVIEIDHALFPQYATVQELLNSAALSQVGSDVVISLDANNTITIQNAALSTLKTQPADFHFV